MPRAGSGRDRRPRLPPTSGLPYVGSTRLTRASSSLSISWINRKGLEPVVWTFPVSDGSHPGTTAAFRGGGHASAALKSTGALVLRAAVTWRGTGHGHDRRA